MSESQTVKLTIDNKTIVRVMAVGFAFVVGLKLVGVLEPVLRLLVMAIFLALALNPPVSYFAKHVTAGRRALATGITYVLFLSALGLFLAVVIPPFARETANFIDNLPAYVDELQTGDGFISDKVRDLRLDEQLDKLTENVSDYIGPANQVLLNGIGAIGTFIFSLLTVLVLAFFMLVEGPGWVKHFWETQSPERRKRYVPVMYRVYRVITGFVNGQLLIALIAATTALIALIISGVSYPLPLAAIVGLFSLIPLVGATLGAAVVVGFSLFTSTYAALFMLIFFLVYQQIENNVLQPYIQSKNLDLSPLLVLIAVLFGAMLGGLLGGLLAIPAAASIKIFYSDYHDQRVAKHKKK